MPAARSLRLAAIGTAAGLVSGLFGGAVIVPLLVLWLGYGLAEATGTSLAAIVPTAAVGMTAQALYGNVHYGYGLLIGLPALAGVLVGTHLQQRVPSRMVARLFAGLLAVVAVELLVR